MEKKKIILPRERYHGATDEDLNVNVGLESSKNLLREGDRNIVLDINALFDKERNQSNNYKIHGKLRMVFRNMYSGTTTYDPLREKLYLVGDGSTNDFTGFLPYEEFAFRRLDVKRDEVNPHTTTVVGQYSPSFTTKGESSHVTVPMNQSTYHNWGVYLTYVYGSDSEYPMKYTLSGGTTTDFLSGDGIPFRVSENDNSYFFTSPVEHGMLAGEYITISGGTMDNTVPLSGRTFAINEVGNEIHNSEKYVVTISKSEIPNGTTLPTVILGKRCIDRSKIEQTSSVYYIHKHKTLTENTECVLDSIGFESSIWEEEKKLLLENSAGESDVLVRRNRMETLVYDFKNPLILTGITNNLGYTPTEVYVSTVFKNSNGYFDYPVKLGYKFNFHNTWIDEHFKGSNSIESTIPSATFTNTVGGTTFSFTRGEVLPIGTVLNGAFIEYNKSELKERVVSEAYHKLTSPTNIFDHLQDNMNTFSGVTNDNTVGLYYEPHHRVKLRQLSPYLESYRTNNILNLPQNAKYFEEESIWKWRDLYDHGFIDSEGNGVNFPFINNIHYVHSDINMYLRNEQQWNNKTDGIKFFKKIIC